MSYSEVKGDLIKMAKNGDFNVIIHGCNCFCTMGSGIAAQIKRAFPKAYEADCCTAKGAMKVGHFTWAKHDQLTIINAYTQYEYGRDGKDRFDYNGFLQILYKLCGFLSRDAKVGMPMIGAGLAGGDWERIRGMIQRELADFDVTVVIYE